MRTIVYFTVFSLVKASPNWSRRPPPPPPPQPSSSSSTTTSPPTPSSQVNGQVSSQAHPSSSYEKHQRDQESETPTTIPNTYDQDKYRNNEYQQMNTEESWNSPNAYQPYPPSSYARPRPPPTSWTHQPYSQQQSQPHQPIISQPQQEEEMINEMLRRFPPGMLDKPTVKRFLIARDWEMTRATQLLHEYLNWKKNFGCPVDPRSCLTELEKGKTFIHGTDRNGNVLIYHFVRNQDPTDRDLQEAIRAAVFWAEQAELLADSNLVTDDTSSSNIRHNSGKITLCFVRSGATSSHSDLTLARAIAPVLQNNFPERLEKVLVYPAGAGFRAAWLACQLFLDVSTRRKVIPILDSYELFTYIPPEHLLTEFGGLDDYIFKPIDIPGINENDLILHEKKKHELRQRKIEEFNLRRIKEEEEKRRQVDQPFSLPFFTSSATASSPVYYERTHLKEGGVSSVAGDSREPIEERPYGYPSKPQHHHSSQSFHYEQQSPQQQHQHPMMRPISRQPPPPPQQSGWFSQVFGGLFRNTPSQLPQLPQQQPLWRPRQAAFQRGQQFRQPSPHDQYAPPSPSQHQYPRYQQQHPNSWYDSQQRSQPPGRPPHQPPPPPLGSRQAPGSFSGSDTNPSSSQNTYFASSSPPPSSRTNALNSEKENQTNIDHEKQKHEETSGATEPESNDQMSSK